MAVVKVDELSKDDRFLVVAALETLLASQVRSVNSAKTPAIREVYVAEADKTRAMIARFR